MMNKVALGVALGVMALLSACGESPVTPTHIAAATASCLNNGGLRQIDWVSTERLYESCGYRCTKATAVYEYKVALACKNGARFDLHWQS